MTGVGYGSSEMILSQSGIRGLKRKREGIGRQDMMRTVRSCMLVEPCLQEVVETEAVSGAQMRGPGCARGPAGRGAGLAREQKLKHPPGSRRRGDRTALSACKRPEPGTEPSTCFQRQSRPPAEVRVCVAPMAGRTADNIVLPAFACARMDTPKRDWGNSERGAECGSRSTNHHAGDSLIAWGR